VTIHTEMCGQMCLVQGWQNFLKVIPKFLEISKKFFCLPMGILKSKIRSWSLPQLLLILHLLLLLMHNIIIILYF